MKCVGIIRSGLCTKEGVKEDRKGNGGDLPPYGKRSSEAIEMQIPRWIATVIKVVKETELARRGRKL